MHTCESAAFAMLAGPSAAIVCLLSALLVLEAAELLGKVTSGFSSTACTGDSFCSSQVEDSAGLLPSAVSRLSLAASSGAALLSTLLVLEGLELLAVEGTGWHPLTEGPGGPACQAHTIVSVARHSVTVHNMLSHDYIMNCINSLELHVLYGMMHHIFHQSASAVLAQTTPVRIKPPEQKHTHQWKLSLSAAMSDRKFRHKNM